LNLGPFFAIALHKCDHSSIVFVKRHFELGY
jgi:hypothetical protein